MAEKVFEYFLQVPANVRMKMFDEMEPDDKCRMTRCSKLCGREVRSSKNYAVQLELVYLSEQRLTIDVRHGKNGVHGFKIIMHVREDRKRVTCFTLRGRPLWERLLYSTPDLTQIAIAKFRVLLWNHQNTVKNLIILFSRAGDSEMLRNVNFRIDSLENLEVLMIYGSINVQQFLSVIQHPLKKLCVDGERNIPIAENLEQIYQIKKFSWSCLTLNSQQFSRLSAFHIYINIGQLTERDIFHFIRSWQNGTVGREIRSYGWKLQNSNFDTQKLLRLLRVHDEEAEYIEIKHFNEPGKSGRLRHTPLFVVFRS